MQQKKNLYRKQKITRFFLFPRGKNQLRCGGCPNLNQAAWDPYILERRKKIIRNSGRPSALTPRATSGDCDSYKSIVEAAKHFETA